MPRPLHVQGMGGLGDCVYTRPLIRHLLNTRGELWLSTPYPELYRDLDGVYPVKWRGALRCQSKNMARFDGWSLPPRGAERLRILYALLDLRRSVTEEMEYRAKQRIRHFRFDLPDFAAPVTNGAYAVVRPVSVRSEWRNTARNPDPAYVGEAARLLRERGFRVICVADIDGEQETQVGEPPEADAYFVRGELDTSQLMALVANAAVVVGGVGWIVPTALAYHTPAVIIGGGLGHHNSPYLLVDSRMDASRMRFILPDDFCMCRNPQHACRKTISGFADRFAAALDELAAPALEAA